MKVEIENTPITYPEKREALFILDNIIKKALQAKNLNELKYLLDAIDTSGYKIGFGGGHCWVKQHGNDNRILLITEK